MGGEEVPRIIGFPGSKVSLKKELFQAYTGPACVDSSLGPTWGVLINKAIFLVSKQV